jgi:acyl carrier protein
VAARGGAGGERRLVAYLVAAGAAAGGEPAAPRDGLDPAQLRQFLRRTLPEAMVPQAFVVLPALPLTANGKVDRKALPEPDGTAPGAARVAPRNATEAELARIFAEVLGVPEVGIHDDFFTLGGHSLLAVQVASRCARAFGAELKVRRLFEAPTVAQLAELLGRSVPPPRASEKIDALLARLAALSEEEALALVAEKSRQRQGRP